MTTKHASNYLTYKYYPPEPSVAEFHPSFEQQAMYLLEFGHKNFFQERYQDALWCYLQAYSTLHKLLHPDFPEKIAIVEVTTLLDLDVFDHIMAASVEVTRFRETTGHDLPVVVPIDPPSEILSIIAKLGTVSSAKPPSQAQNLYDLGVKYLQKEAVDEAQEILSRGLAANRGRDDHLAADLNTAIGVALMKQGERSSARQAFLSAQKIYSRLQLDSEQAVVNNNLGVLETLDGNHLPATAAFRAAGDHLPLDLGRRMTQSVDSDKISAIARPMGSQSLKMILRSVDEDGGWAALPIQQSSEPAGRQKGVFVDNKVIQIDFQNDPVEDFKRKIYEPRIDADSEDTLLTVKFMPFNWAWFIPHIYGFTLPLSIGDCFFEIGEQDKALSWYVKARNYPYLNQPIEAPLVWLKMANACLQAGHFLMENQDKEAAQTQYEKIVRLSEPMIDPASPLYASPVFDSMRTQVEAILNAPQPLDVDAHNPAIVEVVFLASFNLQGIASGADLPLLSLAREQVPVFTFEYLQNIARYFAEHAIQAERTYIHFKTSAEQEHFTREMLENAVELEEANEALEAKKVEIAKEQQDVVDANLEMAELQLDNAKDQRSEYSSVSLKEISLEADIAFASGQDVEFNILNSGYEEYGLPEGSHSARHIMSQLTRARREISREYELNNMDRRISELDASRQIAQEQKELAQKQVEAAEAQRIIASVRRQHAMQQLMLFDSQEFTPDLWYRLANNIKAISQTYLGQAIIIARLMEQACEFEIGQSINMIKSSYTRNDLSGLLGGDFLLRDIDSFTFWRTVLGQKKQPIKEVISLADRYPVQFQREFQRTGRMNFRTELSDFDRNFPGSYQRRIKRVEVVVEGLIGRSGIHGTLTNTGLCLTRLHNSDVKMRLLKPETLLLSQYRLSQDSLVFTPDSEMLTIFENSPVSTSWVLELHPSVNDLVYKYIADVKLVIYYEAFFDLSLKQRVLEELAESQLNTARRRVALRYELFDEFFAFQDTGEVRFMLRETMLPFYHTAPVIRDMTILVRTSEQASPSDLVVHISAADGTDATQTTDADGTISTGSGAGLDTLVGQPFLQEWTIGIPQAPNQARFDDGFQWAQVDDIVVIAEYEFVPRRVPGEPQLLLRDPFDQDPLALFDVVDDPQATNSHPSNWVFNASSGRIEQTANIHGPEGISPNNDHPNKPGTYLLRKSAPTLPDLQDLILTCRLRSEDNDGIGLVFRWQDVDNFYFFLMDHQKSYRRIGKKVAGVFQELDTPAVDTERGYEEERTYTVKVRAKGQSLRVYLDGELALSGEDNALVSPGRVGFFAWANPGAQFDDLRVIAI